MTPARVDEIQQLIDVGLSDLQIAERLGLKRDTIYRTVKTAIASRRQKGGSPDPVVASTASARSVDDHAAATDWAPPATM